MFPDLARRKKLANFTTFYYIVFNIIRDVLFFKKKEKHLYNQQKGASYEMLLAA